MIFGRCQQNEHGTPTWEVLAVHGLAAGISPPIHLLFVDARGRVAGAVADIDWTLRLLLDEHGPSQGAPE